MHEKPYRSIVKAVSWRLTGTLDTIIVSFIVSRKIGIALAIGGIEVFTKITLYYCHERFWNRISFGRIKPQIHEYDI